MKTRTSRSLTIVGMDWMHHGAARKIFSTVFHLEYKRGDNKQTKGTAFFSGPIEIGQKDPRKA
jgi:hypothetical protein